MQRSIAWIGIALIGTSLSSCAQLRQQLGLEQEAPVTCLLYTSDAADE